MKRSNLIILGLCAMAMLSGCRTVENIGIALHESIDAALSNKPPVIVSALTNAVPTVKPEAANGCDCDQTLPLCDPPYSPKWLDEQGNATECPVPHGMDIRGKTLYPSSGQRYSLHLLPKMVSPKQADGMVYGKCPIVDGIQYHFEGYSRQGETVMTPAKPGELFKYTYKMKVWHNCRKAK